MMDGKPLRMEIFGGGEAVNVEERTITKCDVVQKW